LYTHTKLKHSDGNDGKPVLPVFSGRGRGRPRKNTQKRIDPTTEEYFKSEGREGGPTNPIHGFQEVLEGFKYDEYSDYKKFPLYKYLEKFALDAGCIKSLTEGIHKKIDSKPKENGGTSSGDAGGEGVSEEMKETEGQDSLFVNPDSTIYLTRDINNLPEEERSKLSSDEVFAIYLNEISKKINPEYYKTMLKFIIAYRECLNKYGWEKKAENDEVLNNSGANEEVENTTMITPASDVIIAKARELRDKAKGREFSVINNAEHAPEICNEFVTVFLQERSKEISLTKNESIDLTRNICHWLFTECYTCSKVSMIKS